MDDVPLELDWIKIRLECSIKGAFASLRAGVEKDVKLYNERLNLQSSALARISSEISTIFVVSRRNAADDGHVEFNLHGNSVKVRQTFHGEPSLFSVTPFFSDLGRCRWKLDDDELEEWQVRKLALEELLFQPQFGF